MSVHRQSSPHALSAAGVLITLGIVYGNIGTSPLYVFKAIVGAEVISRELVLGALSCVFWTLLLITTFKYIILALNADYKGEGGIFALYGLVKDGQWKWPAIVALVGCSALLADGFMTPPISISAAVEGLNVLYPDLPTMPIVMLLLTLLFVFQQFGTAALGKAFAPIALLWFGTIGALGLGALLRNPDVLQAMNPVHAIRLLVEHPNGFWVLGGVFLCTTGAEALYADLGHCGKANIRVSWIFVLGCLLLNYFGQSAWLMEHEGATLDGASVFYALVPPSLLTPVIILATAATVIASQALISGCFTLINEAMKMRLWIPMKVTFPAHSKGQLYIGGLNWFLFAGCLAVLFIFQTSGNMEAAYGLTITIDMLMASTLLLVFLHMRKVPLTMLVLLGVLFFGLEVSFLLSNLKKFLYGGWFTFLVAATLFFFLYFYHRARKLRDARFEQVDLARHRKLFEALVNDDSIPLESTHLVYMVKSATEDQEVDANILHSLFHQRPKRARVYWFVHVDILDHPHEQDRNYRVKTIVPGHVFFVRLEFGFKVRHHVNRLFHKAMAELAANGEVDLGNPYPSLAEFNIPPDIKYVFVKSIFSPDAHQRPLDRLAMGIYERMQAISYPIHHDLGLAAFDVVLERAPLHFHIDDDPLLERKEFDRRI